MKPNTSELYNQWWSETAHWVISSDDKADKDKRMQYISSIVDEAIHRARVKALEEVERSVNENFIKSNCKLLCKCGEDHEKDTKRKIRALIINYRLSLIDE